MTDIFPTWKFLLRPDIQEELKKDRKCEGHGFGSAFYGDGDLPDGFFADIDNIANEIGDLIDGVDGITVEQCKEKYSSTRVYVATTNQTKMKVIGNYQEISKDNSDHPIEMPLALARAFELMRRKYPYLAHYIGEYPSLENKCKCQEKGYDALRMCENYAKYYKGTPRKTHESKIAWGLVRLLPNVDSSTKAKALKATKEFKKEIKPFAQELDTFKALLSDPTTSEAELGKQWDKTVKEAKKREHHEAGMATRRNKTNK